CPGRQPTIQGVRGRSALASKTAVTGCGSSRLLCAISGRARAITPATPLCEDPPHIGHDLQPGGTAASRHLTRSFHFRWKQVPDPTHHSRKWAFSLLDTGFRHGPRDPRTNGITSPVNLQTSACSLHGHFSIANFGLTDSKDSAFDRTKVKTSV